jgi:hypothetical protein
MAKSQDLVRFERASKRQRRVFLEESVDGKFLRVWEAAVFGEPRVEETLASTVPSVLRVRCS